MTGGGEGFSAGDVELFAARAEADRPPSQKLPPLEWAQKNLFNGIMNSVLTVLFGAAGLVLAWYGARWVLDADFEIVRRNLRIFMIGQFPKDELWRPAVSFLVLLSAIGFTSGALARNAYELALDQDLPAEKEAWSSLLRRFWAILAVIVFFVSFARTLTPYLLVLGAFVTVVASREFGWAALAAIRTRAVYIGAMLFIVSLLVVAGTSTLGGLALGLIAATWTLSELGGRDLPGGLVGLLIKLVVALTAALVVFVIEVVIPFDGFGWEDWGGIHITLFTTVLGISLGMPFGILLALGRKSDLPVMKTASVIFIEFIRGVPLISLLLFSNLMLKNFFPLDFKIPADLTLAIIVITGFSAAYIAEIVRGGLQAVPKGQTEAAQASGMSVASIQRLIVLPQALRAVIPAMVGQFIALFKDTTLLSIIGILEFLRVTDVANVQPDFLGKGLAPVTYLFVALGYWAFAYTMSKESRRLETKLGVGVR
jgi:general L-amino acid transport system permease protein